MSDSDITIICPNGRQLLCHRAVLASRSLRLNAVFASGEYTGAHLPVSGVDSAALEAVVSSFYSGQCPVAPDTVVAIHDAASKLEVQDLMGSCMAYLNQILSLDNCCTLYSSAEAIKDAQIVDVCRHFIHQRFPELAGTADFNKQPFEVVTSILLDVNKCSITTPMTILHAAASWLARQPNRDGMRLPLLQHIQLPNYLSMLDGLIAKYFTGGDQLLANNSSSGASTAVPGAMPDARMSVGNLVMPSNGMRESINGARLLQQPMDAGPMPPMHPMIPHPMYMQQPPMGDPHQQPMYMGVQDHMHPMYQQSMMNNGMMGMNPSSMYGTPRGYPEPMPGSARKGNQKSPAGRRTPTNPNAGSGRPRRNVRNKKIDSEAQSEEENHSDATRSMPAHGDQSDEERTSHATSHDRAEKIPRPSWFGGDGVLALAEAAAAAEQNRQAANGSSEAVSKQASERASEDSKPVENGVGSNEQNGDASDTQADGSVGPGPSKRIKTENHESGQLSHEQFKSQGSESPTKDMPADEASKPAEGGPSMSPQRVQAVLDHYMQNLGSLTAAPATTPGLTPGLTGLTGTNAPGMNWGLAGVTNSLMPGLTADAAPMMNGDNKNNNFWLPNLNGFDTASLLPQPGTLLESVTSAAGVLPPSTATIQQLINNLNTQVPNNASRQHNRNKRDPAEDLPLPPPREPKPKGSRHSQAVKGVCHVDNCGADLAGLRDYHQRYKICDMHLKAPSIMRDGIAQRFCQQCGRFHTLDAFDGIRRSCRAMLQRHNARRNKRNADGLPLPPADGVRSSAMAAAAAAAAAANAQAQAQAQAAQAAAQQNLFAQQLQVPSIDSAVFNAATAAAAVAAAAGGMLPIPRGTSADAATTALMGVLNTQMLGMTGTPALSAPMPDLNGIAMVQPDPSANNTMPTNTGVTAS